MKKMFWLGIGMGVMFWFTEAAVHVFLFKQHSYFIEVLRPDQHEIWMRLLVVGLFFIFGFYAQFVIDKRNFAQRQAKLAYQEIEQIFNTAADGMRVIDKDFNILRTNATLALFSGVSKEESAGKKCYEVFHGPMCNTPRCPLALISAGESRVEYYVEKERRDGTKIPCIVTATPFHGTDGELIGIVEDFKNMTEYNRTEKRLKELNEELFRANKRLSNLALRDPHTGLYNYRYLKEVIESEFNRAKRNASHLSLMMIDVDYFKSINDVYGHQFGDLVLKQLARQFKRLVRQYDSVIRFGGEEFIIICPGADKASILILAQRLLDDINLYNFGDEKQSVKLRLSIAIISCLEDNLNKSIELVDFADKILEKVKEDGGNRVYSASDLKKEKFTADEKDTGAAYSKSLKDKLERLNKRAHQSVVEAVFAFAKTIELKDHYTGEHVEETVRYVTEIGRALNLSNNEIERLREAAILHDLGKIGITEQILLKRWELTKEEYEDIKKHPQIGVDIIRPIQSLHPILPLILYHHERWDGKGYPYGLKNEEIPVGARIITVADVYQALISARPYRQAYSKEEAMEIIKSSSGSHFDPKIAGIFLKILQAKNKDENKDGNRDVL